MADPVIGSFVPAAASTIATTATIQFDVTDADNDLERVFLYAKFPNLNLWEVIHDGDAFNPKYSANSTRTGITNGYRYVVKRADGWPDAPTLNIAALDVTTGGTVNASDVVVTTGGGIVSTNAQTALQELQTEITNNLTTLSNHLAAGDHDALAIAGDGTVDGSLTTDILSAIAGLNIPQYATGDLPTTLDDGSLAWDTTTEEVKYWDGTDWQPFGGGGGLTEPVTFSQTATFGAATGAMIQTMESGVADGASAVGFTFDTTNALANAAAKLVSIENDGTEKAHITKDGGFVSKAAAGAISFKMESGAHFDWGGGAAVQRLTWPNVELLNGYVLKADQVNCQQRLCLSYADMSGTPGNVTCNTVSGVAAVANGASSVVITNSYLQATGVAFAILQDVTDALQVRGCTIAPGGGSFTITLTGATTAARKVYWFVSNPG